MEPQSNQQQVKQITDFVEKEFESNFLPGLKTFISIPNVSRGFDNEWDKNGLLEKAGNFIVEWTKKQELKGAKVELFTEPSKTPMVFIEVDGTTPDAETVLFYGHLDKQPHMVGWREGLGPTTPVIEDDKLYGRGGADDGYSTFAAVLIIKTCQALGLSHPRCVITIEADEETDSRDLPYYYDLLADRIGTPSTIICLDAGCGNYEQLWAASTLRGILESNLTIKITTEGVHSGDGSGVIPDTFRIARILLDRLEDQLTGKVHKGFHVEIPEERYKQAEKIAKILGDTIIKKFPWIPSAKSMDSDPFVCYLNRIWRPTLTVLGVDSIPPVNLAGNVLRPETTFKLSIRMPPTLKGTDAAETLKEILLKDPPYGAEVTLDNIGIGNGWNAPPSKQYFDEAAQQASLNFFGKEVLYFGEGGSIPFLDMLSEKFPKCQFFVTGILGPNSNAHGPNEFLHIPFTKKLVCCLVQMLNACYEGPRKSNSK